MTTGSFVRRGGVMTRIAPQATGHEWAGDGTVLGVGWDATRYDLSLRGIQQFRGSAEEVRLVASPHRRHRYFEKSVPIVEMRW